MIDNKKPKISTDEEKSTPSKSRTSVIKQLFTRKTTDFTPKKTPSPSKKSSNSPRISIKKSPTSPILTSPNRSKSLTIENRKPTIFKQKTSSPPLTKPEKKKRQTTKDPMSIFDFDDDENANGIIQLRTSETKKQEKKSNRRSTLVIQNNIPSDAICKECSTSGTSQTMTE